ncbi:MAG: hypothetical protein QM650_10635 [Microlunatus sp.]
MGLAVTLTEHWTESVWDRVGQLLEAGVPEVPYEPAEPRRVRQRHRVTWLKPEQVAAMTADYESGMTVVAVAKKYGVAPETASRRLKANGVTIRPPTVSAIPTSELETARRLRAEGWTYTRIAARYGCSRAGAFKALERAGAA